MVPVFEFSVGLTLTLTVTPGLVDDVVVVEFAGVEFAAGVEVVVVVAVELVGEGVAVVEVGLDAGVGAERVGVGVVTTGVGVGVATGVGVVTGAGVATTGVGVVTGVGVGFGAGVTGAGVPVLPDGKVVQGPPPGPWVMNTEFLSTDWVLSGPLMTTVAVSIAPGGALKVLLPTTSKPPEALAMTLPAEMCPSPQSIPTWKLDAVVPRRFDVKARIVPEKFGFPLVRINGI